MNRLDKLRLLAAAEAVAGQIRRELKDDAEAAFAADGMTVTWNAAGVTAAASRTHERVEVADADEFMCWLLEHHPDWVTTVVVPRNQDQIKKFLADLAQQGPHGGTYPEAPGGTAPASGDIPGLVWVRGGQFKTVSVTVDGTTKRELAKLAAQALKDGKLPRDLGPVFEGYELASE